ncbi:alanyl-tRNA editing protein AlaX-L, partial [Clostridioides difficile]|nr:alanyl-tRNA editing protein AlaX-L [Clostridioides difficile]
MIEKANKVGNISVIKKIYDDEDLKYVNKIANKIAEYDISIALFAVTLNYTITLVFAFSNNLIDINIVVLLQNALSHTD